jgi:AmpE protein
MKFLVLLLVLLLETFSSWRSRIQQDRFWLRLLARAEGRPRLAASPWLSLVLLVFLPALLLGLLLVGLHPLAYGWLALPVHLLVLIYSLGRGDVQVSLGPFRDAWRRGDIEAAYLVAERDLALEVEGGDALLEQVQGYLLWQAYQGLFAVIFWYVLLGPVAALAYRLLALTDEHAHVEPLRERAVRLRHVFDWLPARLLAASFGLVGNFIAVSRVLLHELLSRDVTAAKLVGDAGRAASAVPGESLSGEAGVRSLDELWQLLVRAAVIWYAAIALLVLLA